MSRAGWHIRYAEIRGLAYAICLYSWVGDIQYMIGREMGLIYAQYAKWAKSRPNMRNGPNLDPIWKKD